MNQQSFPVANSGWVQQQFAGIEDVVSLQSYYSDPNQHNEIVDFWHGLESDDQTALDQTTLIEQEAYRSPGWTEPKIKKKNQNVQYPKKETTPARHSLWKFVDPILKVWSKEVG